MKLLLKLSIIFAFIFGCITVISAQGPPPPPPPPPAKPTKTIGKADIFEFKNKKTASATFLNRKSKEIMRMTYEVSVDKVGGKPDGMTLIFQSFSDNGYKYKNNRKVYVIINDKSELRGEAQMVMASCSPKKEMECYEVLFSPLLPFSDFEAILKNDNVKIQFGETVFEITAEEKEGLKDLQKTLEN